MEAAKAKIKFSIREIDWAAGFLEGEGCFHPNHGKNVINPTVTCSQVQLQPLSRLIDIFGGRIYFLTDKRNGKKINRWDTTSARAVGIMFTLYGLMSPWRKKQIRIAIAAWKSKRPLAKYRTCCPRGHAYDEKNTIRPKGGGRICRICRKEERTLEMWKRYFV